MKPWLNLLPDNEGLASDFLLENRDTQDHFNDLNNPVAGKKEKEANHSGGDAIFSGFYGFAGSSGTVNHLESAPEKHDK